MKLEVGMKLFKEIYYQRSENKLKEVEIKKVGRKYFYLKGMRYDDKFEIPKEEWLKKGKWGSFYITKELFYEEKKRSETEHKIYMSVNYKGGLRELTLEELETIEKIIFKEEK